MFKQKSEGDGVGGNEGLADGAGVGTSLQNLTLIKGR